MLRLLRSCSDLPHIIDHCRPSRGHCDMEGDILALERCHQAIFFTVDICVLVA